MPNETPGKQFFLKSWWIGGKKRVAGLLEAALRAVQANPITVTVSLLLFTVSGAVAAIAANQMTQGFWQTLVTTLAGGVMSASVVVAIDRIFFTHDLLDELDKRVDELVEESARLTPLVGQGLKKMGARKNMRFPELFADATDIVRVMGISLPLMCDEPAEGVILGKLRDPESGVTFRILLINPWSASSFNRGLAPCYHRTTKYNRGLKHAIERYVEIGQALDDEGLFDLTRFDVRVYGTNPYCSLLIRDHVANVSLFLENQQGAEAPFLEFEKTSKSGDMYSRLSDHFDMVWTDPSTISIFRADFQEAAKTGFEKWNEALKKELPVFSLDAPWHPREQTRPDETPDEAALEGAPSEAT